MDGIASRLFTIGVHSLQLSGMRSDPSVADAILDRIVHSAHVLTMKGESMRKLRARKS